MTPMGRPIKPDAKRGQITLRLKDETLKELKKCAEEMSATRTEVIEHGIELVRKELGGQKKNP